MGSRAGLAADSKLPARLGNGPAISPAMLCSDNCCVGRADCIRSALCGISVMDFYIGGELAQSRLACVGAAGVYRGCAVLSAGGDTFLPIACNPFLAALRDTASLIAMTMNAGPADVAAGRCDHSAAAS